ncbi:energy transducer TonB [Arenicella xantha]|uniref:Protein TonB n=1 Tax=Arenicella xantha TaxID=644221 RepID=A0A395JNI2_9GAMM|nr:energy transducer TonB [Arenicella xantha]RBP53149.1 TonB family protein [Arenicella xantha]
MSADTPSQSVLVISADTTVVETILGGNTTDQQFNARESVQAALAEPNLFLNNSIVIFDIDSTAGDVGTAIDQALKIKQSDPTQVLMLVGEKEGLNEILKSNIQPVVYRAFNKPVSANQISLAFKSAHVLHTELVEKQAAGEDIMVVGPAENRASVDSLAAQRKTNPAIYAGIGVLALAVVGFLIFGGGGEEEQQIVLDTPTEATQVIEDIEADTVSITNELNQQAATALLEGRYVTPAGDNALEYFDQVLEIDPYDSTAYEGRKTVAEAMRSNYNQLVADAQFDEALKTIDALRAIEPLNTNNDQLSADLGKAITAHVKKVRASGSEEEIAETAAVLERLEGDVEGSKTATEALKEEQVLIGNIDNALANGNLIPPQKGNAYSLVSDALKGNKISKANSEPRVKELSAKLLVLANENFGSGNMEETAKLSALIKRLNVDRQGLADLNQKVKAKQEEIAAAKAAEQKTEPVKVAEAKPAPPKILPAKVISRAPPRYPSRALKNGQEGWVQVAFYVNTDGVPEDITIKGSEPSTTFDSAAIKSVEKWRFSPARNQNTGLPVRSTQITTKVQFRLN